MRIQNLTDRVLVYGKHQIPPHDAGEMPDEFHVHAIGLEGRGCCKCVGETRSLVEETFGVAPEPAEPPRTLAPEPPERREDDPTGVFPEDWDSKNTNSKKAWVRRQDDMALLGKLHMLESNDKVREAIADRLDTLEARTR